MKYILVLLTVLSLAGCFKRTAPDESTAIEGNLLRLPPNYSLQAPDQVKTIKTTPKSADSKAANILLKGQVKQDDELNTWLLRNAGGQQRVKNIKAILQDDLKQEQLN